MSDVYKLQYNGMTIAYPGWNGYVGYEEIEKIFHVIVNQPTGGIIIATPIEGPNGTVVVLTNAPLTDYKFISYTVTGATLNNNQFTINGSDVTVTGTFQKTKEVWVNLGSTEYSQTTSGTKSVTLTGMPSSSEFNYFTLVFDAYFFTTSSSAACDLFLRNSSNGTIWRARAHRSLNNYFGFVGITGNVTGWTTQSGQTVTSDNQDGVSYRCSNRWSNAWKRVKFVFDRNNKRCYFYISGTLLGYTTMNVDPIALKNIGVMKETNGSSTQSVKNIRVAAFSTLTDAQAYNG